MSNKLGEKWLDRGTDPGQVSAKSFSSGYTPTNYTPSQVDSEGDDKVSAHLKGIGNKLASLGNGVYFVDEMFTATESQANFTLETPIGEETLIDVMFDGIIQEEGESAVWERDTSAFNRIQVNAGSRPSAGTRVRVRIYSAEYFVEQFFEGGTTTYELSDPITIQLESKVDLYMNGVLMERGEDYTVNKLDNNIFIPNGDTITNENTRIRVRVYL